MDAQNANAALASGPGGPITQTALALAAQQGVVPQAPSEPRRQRSQATHQIHDTMDQRESHPGSERCAGRSAVGRASRWAAWPHRHCQPPYTLSSAGAPTISTSRCPAARRRRSTEGARRHAGLAGRSGMPPDDVEAGAPRRGMRLGSSAAAGGSAEIPHQPLAQYLLLPADRGVQHPAQGERAACQEAEAGPQPGQSGA